VGVVPEVIRGKQVIVFVNLWAFNPYIVVIKQQSEW
jgi:hypothetical protein